MEYEYDNEIPNTLVINTKEHILKLDGVPLKQVLKYSIKPNGYGSATLTIKMDVEIGQ